jgi:hypothetical protein
MRWVIEDDGKTYFLERPKDGLRLEVEYVQDKHWQIRLLVGRPWGWPAKGDVGCVLHEVLAGYDREEAAEKAIGLISIWASSLFSDLVGSDFSEYHP